MADNTQRVPNSTSKIYQVLAGMKKDFHPMQMGDGDYEYMLNGTIENFDGSGLPVAQNEASNIKCTGFPEGYFAVGFVNIIEQNRIIWLLANPTTGASEIGETQHFEECRETAKDGIILGGCDDCGRVNIDEHLPLEQITQRGCCQYRTINNNPCLNFTREFPVNSVEYRILACSVQVFFTDSNNGRRWIEFEYTNDDPAQPLTIKKDFLQITGFNPAPCQDPIYSTLIDCNKMNIQPNITTPCINFIDLVGGGSNKAGSYQFFIAYADKLGNKLSSYFSSTNPIPIRTRDITLNTDYVTDRAMALGIENTDLYGPFQYYNLAVAKTINGFTSFALVGTFPITQNKYTYTGNDASEIKLTADDIFQRLPYYKTAGAVTASNNLLFWANPVEFPKLNLQRVANNIRLQWQTIAIPEAVYRSARNVNKYRGHMRDEVYPYGIQFLYENGEESPAYHIPGRAPISTDLEIVNNNDAIKETNCVECGNVNTDTQLTIGSLNSTVCPGPPSGITLVTDNSHQSSSCPLTPYTQVGCIVHSDGINPIPIVNAGSDQTITYVGSVSLNGTATVFAPAVTVAVQWQQLSGPNQVIINNATTLNTYFNNINTGTYIFRLCVTDSNGNRNFDDVQFDVNVPVNQPPVADPGADKIVTLPLATSYLNGANSTDDEGIQTYAWSQVSGPNTATIANNALSYTAVSGLIAGTYQFKLIVTDIRGCSSEATTKIYVVNNPCDSAPFCTSLLYPINGSITSSYSTVVLQWQTVECADSYDIYLRPAAGSFTLVGNSVSDHFTLSSLTPNTAFDWYVVPKNTHGSAPSCDACYRSFVTPTQSANTTCDKRRWQVYNTATLEGGDLEIYQECNETCYQFGNMAYWESTEKYPNIPLIWGSLCGMPIRHHKFPDSLVTHIHDGNNGNLDYTRNNLVFPIGVKVDHDSVRASIAAAVTAGLFSQVDADRITGYRIVRGNRFKNKSVVAKGIVYDVNHYRRKAGGSNFDNTDVYFSNFPFNDVRDNPFITDNFDNYKDHNSPKGPDLPFIFSNRYTFHSPDTHFSEPAAGTQVKLETVEYGQAEGYYTVAQKQARQKFLSDTSYAIAFTAGIVATLLKTQEKEIKQYTVKGSIVSGLGLASGELGPFLPYQTGTGAAIVPESVVDTIVNPFQSASINAATEVTTQTVQGKYGDYVNPVYLAQKKPQLLPFFPLMLANYLTGFLTMVLQETNIILDLIKSLTPYRDWSIQYNGVGKYNSYKPVLNTGNKIRALNSYSYLKSENAFINEPSETNPAQSGVIKYNNYQRETSLYVQYKGAALPNAGTASGIVDTSRDTFEDGIYGCSLDKRGYTNISSYYAALKNYVPDQYGTIYNIEYLRTDSCDFPINQLNSTCRGVYGGDTFINRFAFKNKVPYFLATTFGLPDGTDFDYELYANLGVPRHYFNSTLGVGTNIGSLSDIFSIFTPTGLATFLGRPKSIRDCETSKFFYQNGYIYVYSYGIPYFLVESDVNVDYRTGENNLEGDFYPHQTDLDFWLQEKNVPIREDNTYFYNSDYSKQNKETFIGIDGPDFQPSRVCRVAHPNRIIYATDGNWLTYKANDFFDYPMSKGRIVSIEGIENATVLVRSINSASVFKSVLRTIVDGQTVQTGNGSVFSNPPQEFAETPLGYVGTQHKAILHTEYGHIWVDAKRGQVFNLSSGGNGLDEISKDGMKNWFKENLPFRLLRDFPNMPEEDVDNNFLGSGIAMAFDKRLNRFFLTKLDYKKKDATVQYDPVLKEFYKIVDSVRVVVKLGDKRYFTDVSWTVGYNFFTKSWVSFYSFKPNYYAEAINFFGSGVDSGFWLHNMTNSSYQVFYGQLYPFIVEPILKFTGSETVLKSMEFDTEVRRYENEFDYLVRKKIPGFNKTVVYNDRYCSGNLNMVKTDKGDISQSGIYPVRNAESWDIEVAIANYKWRFNQFYNLLRDYSELPIWLYNGNNADKELNTQAFSYLKDDFSLARLRGQWFKSRFTNDSLSNYKILFKFGVDNKTTDYR